MLIAAAYAALAYSSGGYSTELIAAVTVGVWWVVILALITRVVPATDPAARDRHGRVPGGVRGLTALSMIWANDPAGRSPRSCASPATWACFVLTVLVSARTGARPWLAGIAIGIVVIVVGADLSRFDPSLFGGADRSIFVSLPASNGRLSYPVGYWNGLGAILAIGILLLAWFGSFARSRLWRAAATAALPALGLAMYLTSSRGGLVATAVGVCVFLVFSREWVRILGALVIGALTSAVLIGLTSQWEDVRHALTTHDAYVQGRWLALATVLCVLAAGAVRYAADGWLGRVRLPRKVARRGLAAVVVLGLIVLAFSHPIDRLREFSNSNDIARRARRPAAATSDPSPAPGALSSGARPLTPSTASP